MPLRPTPTAFQAIRMIGAERSPQGLAREMPRSSRASSVAVVQSAPPPGTYTEEREHRPRWALLVSNKIFASSSLSGLSIPRTGFRCGTKKRYHNRKGTKGLAAAIPRVGAYFTQDTHLAFACATRSGLRRKDCEPIPSHAKHENYGFREERTRTNRIFCRSARVPGENVSGKYHRK